MNEFKGSSRKRGAAEGGDVERVPDRVDVVLVQPPIRDAYLTHKRTIPYGLARIAACLRAAGHSVAIIDGLACSRSRPLSLPLPLQQARYLMGSVDRSPFALVRGYKHYGRSFEAIAKQVAAHAPRVVGLSALFSAYEAEALQTARAIKALLPEVTLVVGGHHASELPERLLAEPAVDLVLRGEGERTLPRLVTALAHPNFENARPTIAGLCWREATGSLRLQAPSYLSSIDELPPPALDLIAYDFYRDRLGARTVIVSSRGCRLRCRYCALGSRCAAPYRQSSLPAILEEIALAVETHGVRFIDFEDENIGWDRAWFQALLAAISARYQGYGLELRAMNGLLPRTLDAELVAAMRDAGFRALNLSLGSSHPARLRSLQRPDERAAFDRALGFAEAYGLEAIGYVIGAGPGQTAAESVADLLYLAARRVLVGLSVFYPAPGSELFKELEQRGELPADPACWRATALPLGAPTTRLQTTTLLRLARLLNFAKALVDREGALPPAQPLGNALAPELDRNALGSALLAAYLDDGRLRGVDETGAVYLHEACEVSARSFRQGLSALTLRGVRS